MMMMLGNELDADGHGSLDMYELRPFMTYFAELQNAERHAAAAALHRASSAGSTPRVEQRGGGGTRAVYDKEDLERDVRARGWHSFALFHYRTVVTFDTRRTSSDVRLAMGGRSSCVPLR